MKKIVFLGLLILLAGTNTPSTIQAKQEDGKMETTRKAILKFLNPWNSIKKGGNAFLHVGVAGSKAIKHLGLATGNTIKHLGIATLKSSEAFLSVLITFTAVVALFYGTQFTYEWISSLLPEIISYGTAFWEMVLTQYNHLATIITPHITAIPRVLVNLPKNIWELTKSFPGILTFLQKIKTYISCQHINELNAGWFWWLPNKIGIGRIPCCIN